MKHQRAKDISKITTSAKTWDSFGWWYFSQPHRLWKKHWLKDNCAMCRWEREFKRLKKKRERIEGRRAIHQANYS